jgi:hypothetical protein
MCVVVARVVGLGLGIGIGTGIGIAQMYVVVARVSGYTDDVTGTP